MSKKQLTLWGRIQANVYGWSWVFTWFASIWWEAYRWPLFWTGALCLFFGILVVSGTEDASHSQEGEQ